MTKLTIWYGKTKPITAVGKHQVNLLHFLERHKGWHTMGKDKATQRAVIGLIKRGSILYDSQTRQACIVYAQTV